MSLDIKFSKFLSSESFLLIAVWVSVIIRTLYIMWHHVKLLWLVEWSLFIILDGKSAMKELVASCHCWRRSEILIIAHVIPVRSRSLLWDPNICDAVNISQKEKYSLLKHLLFKYLLLKYLWGLWNFCVCCIVYATNT